jgi:hypothetical protein
VNWRELIGLCFFDEKDKEDNLVNPIPEFSLVAFLNSMYPTL